MHRSSESVAALASALAKAQAHLVNPEKSLIATIRSGRPGEGDRSFRYAPLSSGLDIVRKTLGQHEIAIVQTTAIDSTAGLVNLTTVLAHASGEWIASDWPVCPIAESVHPQRMGAALTYARRYALFTLVGIAGEDDLDAPDLCVVAVSPAQSTIDVGRASTVQDGRSRPQTPRPGNGKDRDRTNSRPALTLPSDQSAALRDKLLADLSTMPSADRGASWARAALPAKNTLTAADAKLVEDAFERWLAKLPSPQADTPVNDDASMRQGEGPPPGAATAPQAKTTGSAVPAPATGIDKSLLAITAPRRYRNRDHLRFVAQQPCLICGRKPSDPHHLRYLQLRALGRKASDEFTVPLCRIHHRLVHRVGNESAWWKDAGIDPVKVARQFWERTRAEEGRIGPKANQAPRGVAFDRT